MLKIKRLLTEEEFDKYISLRENKGVKPAAKYLSSLQDELVETVDLKKSRKTYE